jgi:hypothetical protein
LDAAVQRLWATVDDARVRIDPRPTAGPVRVLMAAEFCARMEVRAAAPRADVATPPPPSRCTYDWSDALRRFDPRPARVLPPPPAG